MVVIIIPALISGGTEWQLLALARGLAVRHGICLWVYDGTRVDAHLEKEFRSIPGLEIVFRARFRALREIVKRRPQIILSYAINYYLPEIAAKLLSNATLITERRNLYHWLRYQKRRRTQELIRNALTRRVICNSQAVAERVRGLEPLVSDKINVIHNSVSPISIMPGGGSPKIVAVSNIKLGKGLEIVMKAYECLRAEHCGDNLDFAIYGRLDEPEALGNASSDAIARVCRGLAPREQVFSDAIIILHLSESEGFPAAVLEAVSLGVVPVLSDIPVHRELFSDCARFVRSASDTVEVLKELFAMRERDPAAFLELSARCRAASEKYSLSVRVEKYEATLSACRH